MRVCAVTVGKPSGATARTHGKRVTISGHVLSVSSRRHARFATGIGHQGRHDRRHPHARAGTAMVVAPVARAPRPAWRRVLWPPPQTRPARPGPVGPVPIGGCAPARHRRIAVRRGAMGCPHEPPGSSPIRTMVPDAAPAAPPPPDDSATIANLIRHEVAR